MKARIDRVHRAAPVIIGAITLLLALGSLVRDVVPNVFSSRIHDLMGALSLALIALAYLVYQSIRRPGPSELFKAVLLAIAFLSWAANQFWPDRAMAPVFNDIAVALFVLDVFLVIVGWPATSPQESFADAYVESRSQQDE
jgi:hypothetical protein